MEIKNAIIEKAILDIGDRGLLTSWIHLKYQGSGQGFGGYSLYRPDSFSNHGGANYAGHFIYRVMKIAGVKKWDDLSGKCLRVRATDSKIEAIGHIIEDEWFNVSEEFEKLEEDLKSLISKV